MWTIIYKHIDWKRVAIDILSFLVVAGATGYAVWLIIAHIAGE
jgi:hypothetical protein